MPPGLHEGAQFRELLRLFWRRFFDNDLIAPNAETRLALVPILSLLAVPGLIFSLRSYQQYNFHWTRIGFPIPPLPLDLEVSWFDKCLLLSVSMILMGFVTVLEWETLLPDRRDFLILTPLPIRLRTLFAAKIAGLFLFLLLFTAALNLCSTVIFPLMAMNPHAPPSYAARYIAAHAVSVFSANALVLLSCIGAQGVLMNVFSPRMFQVISRYIQLLLLFLFVCLFFLLPNLLWVMQELTNERSPLVALFPPMWFAGLYESLQGKAHPGFQGLAVQALQAVAVVFCLFVVTYALSFQRHVKRSLETGAWSQTSLLPSSFQHLDFLSRIFLRKPAERAVFCFIMQTLLRSSQHRLYLGAYIGVGLSITLVGVIGTLVRSSEEGLQPHDPTLLSVPLVLSFFVLCGMRFIFAVPAELGANWAFRLAGGANFGEYLAGARKAMWTVGVAPLPLVLSPFYAALWGWTISLVHASYVIALSAVLTELLLLRFHKVPFTCSYLPGKANIKLYWFPYVMAFVTYAYGMVSLERWMWGNPVRFALFLGVVLVLCAAFRACVRSPMVLKYEESPEPAVRTLNLSH